MPVQVAGLTFRPPHNQKMMALGLWVVITDPRDDDDRVVVVPIRVIASSLARNDICMVAAEDHPDIEERSFVDYGAARPLSVSKLLEGLTSEECAVFERKENASASLLGRIQAGALDDESDAPMDCVNCVARHLERPVGSG